MGIPLARHTHRNSADHLRLCDEGPYSNTILHFILGSKSRVKSPKSYYGADSDSDTLADPDAGQRYNLVHFGGTLVPNNMNVEYPGGPGWMTCYKHAASKGRALRIRVVAAVLLCYISVAHSATKKKNLSYSTKEDGSAHFYSTYVLVRCFGPISVVIVCYAISDQICPRSGVCQRVHSPRSHRQVSPLLSVLG